MPRRLGVKCVWLEIRILEARCFEEQQSKPRVGLVSLALGTIVQTLDLRPEETTLPLTSSLIPQACIPVGPVLVREGDC